MQNPLVGGPPVVADLPEHLFSLLPSVHEHGRVGACTPLVIEEARHEAPGTVIALRVVIGHVGALHLLLDQLAVFHFFVVELEIGRVQRVDQRHVEHAEVDGRLLRTVAVVVPGVTRRQNQVAGTERNVFAVDAGEIGSARQAKPDRIRRMPVRRHHLVGHVDAVSREQIRGCRDVWAQRRIDHDDGAPLRQLHRNELRRFEQARMNIPILPDVRDGGRAVGAELLGRLVFISRLLAPEFEQIQPVRLLVKRGETLLVIGFHQVVPAGRLAHGSYPS